MPLPRITNSSRKILSISITALLAITIFSITPDVLPHALASSTLVCEDAQNNDVRDKAPIPLNTPVKCNVATDNQRVAGGHWVVYDGDGRLYLSHSFNSASDTISFVTHTPKFWTVKVSYFDNVGKNFTPPLPLTESGLSFVVSSYSDNLPPKAVISVIK